MNTLDDLSNLELDDFLNMEKMVEACTELKCTLDFFDRCLEKAALVPPLDIETYNFFMDLATAIVNLHKRRDRIRYQYVAVSEVLAKGAAFYFHDTNTFFEPYTKFSDDLINVLKNKMINLKKVDAELLKEVIKHEI